MAQPHNLLGRWEAIFTAQSIYFLTLTQSVETIPAAGTFFGRLDSLTKKKSLSICFGAHFGSLHGGVLTLFNICLFFQTETKKIPGFSLQDMANFKMEFFYSIPIINLGKGIQKNLKKE